MSNQHEVIDKALSRLVLRHPFYASIVMSGPVIAKPEVGTAATDGTSIYYAPDFFAALNTDEAAFVLAHEAEHIVRLHSFRRGHRDPRTWNIAADHVINNDLKDAGFHIPREEIVKPYMDPKYNGNDYSEEAVYRELEDEKQPEDSQGDGDGESGESGEGDEDGQGDQGQGDGDQQESGSGAEYGDMADDVKQPQGGQEERAEAERKATQRIHKAAHVARQAGTMPAHLKGWLDELTQPMVDWREILRKFVTAVSQDDQSWARLNRRMRHRGMRLPSVHSEQVGELAFVIDTSGSCWHAIPQFISEAAYVAGEIKPETMHVLWTDTQVQRHDVLDDPSEADAAVLQDMVSGGGTDLRAAFDHIEAEGIEPECVVVLTDMMTPFPDEEPGYPVLWVSVDKQHTDDAPFGEAVYIDVEE